MSWNERVAIFSYPAFLKRGDHVISIFGKELGYVQACAALQSPATKHYLKLW